MSFQAMTWAVEQDLPALQKLVLLMLANCCNAHTGRCDPSHDRLAKECVLIEIRRQTQNGVNLPNQYLLRVGASVGVVGADSTDGYVHTAPTVGAHSREGWVLTAPQNRKLNQEVNLLVRAIRNSMMHGGNIRTVKARIRSRLLSGHGTLGSVKASIQMC